MPPSLNRVFLIGRLGKDPEMNYPDSSGILAKFTLATDEYDPRSSSDGRRTEWHRIVVWGRQAEFCGNYLSKGRLVLIEGRLQSRSWENGDGERKSMVEIVAQRVQALDRPSSQPNQEAQKENESFPTKVSALDEVPF